MGNAHVVCMISMLREAVAMRLSGKILFVRLICIHMVIIRH